MAKTPSASDLKHRVVFDARQEVSDDYGNTVSDWQEQFDVSAAIEHLGGREVVIAARREGNEVQRVWVRISSQTRQITNSWRMRDARRGTVYAIDSVDNVTIPGWVHLQVESGAAA